MPSLCNDIFTVPVIPVKELDLNPNELPYSQCDLVLLSYLFHVNRDSHKLFEAIYKRTVYGVKTQVFNIMLKKYKNVNQDDIDEVAAQTYAQVWEQRHTFNMYRGPLFNWLYRIAHNFTLAELDSRERLPVESYDVSDLYNGNEYIDDLPYDVMDDNEYIFIHTGDGHVEMTDLPDVLGQLYDVSVATIETLPENYRVILRDKLVHDKKLHDMAREYHINVSSIKNWLYEGKRQLGKILKNRYPDLYEGYRIAIGY